MVTRTRSRRTLEPGLVFVLVAALVDERLGRGVQEVTDDGRGAGQERRVLGADQFDRLGQEVNQGCRDEEPGELPTLRGHEVI